MRSENQVQGAITAALEVYSDRNCIETEIFSPYANQQGAAPEKYCADVLARLGKSRVLLLEVKELTGTESKGYLPAYDAYQHLTDWILEDHGIPLYYGYGAMHALQYFTHGRSELWPYQTLNKIKISTPSKLFSSIDQQQNARPDQDRHDNLLSWLLNPPPFAAGCVAMLLSAWTASARELSNDVLLIAIDPASPQRLATCSLAQLHQIIGMLYAPDAKLPPDDQANLQGAVLAAIKQGKALSEELKALSSDVQNRLTRNNPGNPGDRTAINEARKQTAIEKLQQRLESSTQSDEAEPDEEIEAKIGSTKPARPKG